LMAQRDIAARLLNDRLLAEQGLLSRFLVTAPDPASGSRMWRDASPESDTALTKYSAHILEILRRELPLVPGTTNTLAPRTVSLSPQAKELWRKFYNHIEALIGAGGELEPVRGLANKLPEHAARMAAVLALVRDIESTEVSGKDLAAGVELAQHYAAEALRLHGASRVSEDLREAQRLLDWLLHSWSPEPAVSLPDIYQRGPNSIRDKAKAEKLVRVLAEHGWLVAIPGGATIKEVRRRQAWRIVRE
jgi:hypothetical protein